MSIRVYTTYLNNVMKCVEGYKPKQLHELSHLSDITTTAIELDDLFYMEELLISAEGEFELISSYNFLYSPLPISTKERLRNSNKPEHLVNSIIENLGELIEEDFDIDINEVYEDDGTLFIAPTAILSDFIDQNISETIEDLTQDGVDDDYEFADEEVEDDEDPYDFDMDDDSEDDDEEYESDDEPYAEDVDDFDMFSEDDEEEDEEFEEDEFDMDSDDEDDLEDDEDIEDEEDSEDFDMDSDEEDDLEDEDDLEEEEEFFDDDEFGIIGLDSPSAQEEDSSDEDEFDMNSDEDDADEDEFDMNSDEDDADEDSDDEFDMDFEDEYEEEIDEFDMDSDDDVDEDSEDDSDEWDMDSDEEEEEEELDEFDMDDDDDDSEDSDEWDMDSDDEEEEAEDSDEFDMSDDDDSEEWDLDPDDDVDDDIDGFVTSPPNNNSHFNQNYEEKEDIFGNDIFSTHQDLNLSRASNHESPFGGISKQQPHKTVDDKLADVIVKTSSALEKLPSVLFKSLKSGVSKTKDGLLVDDEKTNNNN